jgi:hypothetical protein
MPKLRPLHHLPRQLPVILHHRRINRNLRICRGEPLHPRLRHQTPRESPAMLEQNSARLPPNRRQFRRPARGSSSASPLFHHFKEESQPSSLPDCRVLNYYMCTNSAITSNRNLFFPSYQPLAKMVPKSYPSRPVSSKQNYPTRQPIRPVGFFTFNTQETSP